jgi:hypothetical protein
LICLVPFKPNAEAYLPLWSASGIAVRCSALLGVAGILLGDIKSLLELAKSFRSLAPVLVLLRGIELSQIGRD